MIVIERCYLCLVVLRFNHRHIITQVIICLWVLYSSVYNLFGGLRKEVVTTKLATTIIDPKTDLPNMICLYLCYGTFYRLIAVIAQYTTR